MRLCSGAGRIRSTIPKVVGGQAACSETHTGAEAQPLYGDRRVKSGSKDTGDKTIWRFGGTLGVSVNTGIRVRDQDKARAQRETSQRSQPLFFLVPLSLFLPKKQPVKDANAWVYQTRSLASSGAPQLPGPTVILLNAA